jgi:translation initiation factor IF-1
MRTTALLSMMALAGAVVAAPQSVFKSVGSGGYGYASAYNNQYDRNSVITFNGKVTGVQVSAPEPGLGNLVTMLVKAPNGGTAMVEVGPEWYVDQQSPRINVGDRVTVTGSKFIRNGRGIIYASRIQKGNRLLALRDYAGAPFWAAYRAPDQTDFVWEPMIEVTGNQPVIVTTPSPVYSSSVLSQRSGTIEAFTPYTPADSDTVWVVMQLNTGGSIVPVLLGPVWYMERQDVRIETGDLVSVNTVRTRGSAMEYATNLTNQNGYMTLRSPSDLPVWNGWGIIRIN